MADAPQTLSLIVAAQEYRDPIVRQINRRATLLRLIPIRRGAGPACSLVAEADGMVGENFSEGADVSNYGSDAQASGTQAWGHYRANFRVSGLARAVANSLGTPSGNIQLWARNLVNASAKLAATINAGCHTGAGTGTLIAGAGVAIGSTSNIYYGIDRTSATYWQPYVVDPGVDTAPTLKQIRGDLGTIYDSSGEVPDIAVVPTAVFTKLVSLFEPNVRWVKELNTARGLVTLESGYEGISIDGCSFFKDKDAAAGTIEYWNTNHVSLEYLPPEGVPEDFQRMETANDGYGDFPLGFAYELIAKTGDSRKAMVKSYCQLKVSRPNACGMRKHVLTT